MKRIRHRPVRSGGDGQTKVGTAGRRWARTLTVITVAVGDIFGAERPDIERDADNPVGVDCDKLVIPPFNEKSTAQLARTGRMAPTCTETERTATKAESQLPLITKGIRWLVVRQVASILVSRSIGGVGWAEMGA